MMSLLGLTVALLGAQSAASQEQTTIRVSHIKHLIHEDGTGLYQDLMREAVRRAEIPLHIKYLPAKRVIMEIQDQAKGCFLADDANVFEVLPNFKDKIFWPSVPLGGYRVHAFTKNGAPLIHGWEDMIGKNLGLTNHLQPYIGALGWQELASGATFQEVMTDEQNLVKLARDRIDAIIGTLPDLNGLEEQISHDRDFVIAEGKDQIICLDSPQGKSWIDALSAELERMKKDGTTKSIMGKSYLED